MQRWKMYVGGEKLAIYELHKGITEASRKFNDQIIGLGENKGESDDGDRLCDISPATKEGSIEVWR
jgi:hypothetical protein